MDLFGHVCKQVNSTMNVIKAKGFSPDNSIDLTICLCVCAYVCSLSTPTGYSTLAYSLYVYHCIVFNLYVYYYRVPSISQESGSGRTALHLVTEKRSLPLLISLVTDFEVDVDVPTYAGYTPLHIAAGGDSMELVATLVAMGADPYALTDEVEKPEDLPQNAEVCLVNIDVCVCVCVC